VYNRFYIILAVTDRRLNRHRVIISQRSAPKPTTSLLAVRVSCSPLNEKGKSVVSSLKIEFTQNNIRQSKAVNDVRRCLLYKSLHAVCLK